MRHRPFGGNNPDRANRRPERLYRTDLMVDRLRTLGCDSLLRSRTDPNRRCRNRLSRAANSSAITGVVSSTCIVDNRAIPIGVRLLENALKALLRYSVAVVDWYHDAYERIRAHRADSSTGSRRSEVRNSETASSAHSCIEACDSDPLASALVAARQVDDVDKDIPRHRAIPVMRVGGNEARSR